MALLSDDGKLGSLGSQSLRSGEFLVAAPKARETLGQRELIVTSTEKIKVHHLRRSLPARSRSILDEPLEVQSWTVIRSLLQHGLGHGYLPDYVVAGDPKNRKLHRLPLPGRPFRYEIKTIWPRGRDPHPNANRLLKNLWEN